MISLKKTEVESKKIKDFLNNNIDIFFTDIIERLSSIKRYNTRKFIIPQNVLEHEGSVTLISMVISDYFNEIGIKNNTEKVMRMAIFHDTDEIISGDLPHDSKYDYGEVSKSIRSSLKLLEEISFNDIISKIKNDKLIDKYKGIYKEIKAKECIESKIIKLADFIDVIIYSKIENKLGNSSIIKEYNNSTKRFNELLEKILNYYDGE